MKKLMLIHPNKAFDILGEYAGLYSDNGGDPDGDCWLPSNQDTIPLELAQEVEKQGYGKLVHVLMSKDEGIVNYLAQRDPNAVLGLMTHFVTGQVGQEDIERLIDAVYAQGLKWAHYGAYGAIDSHWVFLKEEDEEE